MVKLFIASGLALANAQSDDCGLCWERNESGQCVPESGKISTTCGPNAISVSIDTCVLDGTHVYSGMDLIFYVI